VRTHHLLCGGGGADPSVVQDMFATSPQLNRNPRAVPPQGAAAQPGA
jgi:hypothetical protein